MVYMAMQAGNGPVRKKEIADHEEIPPDYVEQILTKLRTAGLVKSRRGAKGGFVLVNGSNEISIADILRATEGPLTLALCLDEDCSRASSCVTQPVWREASDALEEIFSRITLSSLAERAKHLHTMSVLNYDI